MLEFVEVKVEATDIIVKGLWRVSKYILLYLINRAQNSSTLILFLIHSFFIYFSQEMMNIHCLIHIQEEGLLCLDGHFIYINFGQLRNCY